VKKIKIVNNQHESNGSPFPRRLLWYILTGLSLYWVSNGLVVFPWIFSKTLGIIAMILSTVLWGYMTFYCLKHVPRDRWNKDTLFMALSFLLTGIIQDYFFYALYRGIPKELYEPTTFLAYGLTMLLPFFIRYVVLKNYDLKKVLFITPVKLLITLLIGILSFLFTIWSMKYW
jgi:hypothetical protein